MKSKLNNQNTYTDQSGFIPLFLAFAIAFITVSVGGIYYAKKHQQNNIAVVSTPVVQDSLTLNTAQQGQVAGESIMKASEPVQTPTFTSSGLTPIDPAQVRSAVAAEMKAMLAEGLLQGPKGDKGDTGPTGIQGNPGVGQVLGTTTSAAPGSNPYPLPVSFATAAGLSSNNTGYTVSSLLEANTVNCVTCTVSGTLNATGDTNITNLTVTGATSLADVSPLTAGVLIYGSESTLLVTASGDPYNDAARGQIALDSNDLAFMMYQDNSYHDLHLIVCDDEDCSSKTNTTAVTDSNGVESYSVRIGSDDLPRIVYITYDSPNELHYVVCANRTCTSKTDTLVDSSNSIGNDWFYATSFYLDSSDNAHIFYENFVYGANKALRYANCSNATCSSKTLTTVLSNSSGIWYEYIASDEGPDGFPRVVHATSGAGNMYFLQCTNAACSTSVNTLVSSSDILFLDMQVGSDGFGRITYGDNGDSGALHYVICTNASCSTKSNVEVETASGVDQVSLDHTSEGLPRFFYDNYSENTIGYSYCNDTACTSSGYSDVYVSNGAAIISMVIDSNDLARAVYVPDSDAYVYYAKFNNEAGSNSSTGAVLGTSSTPYADFHSIFVDTNFITADKISIQGEEAIPLTVKTSGNVDLFTLNNEGDLEIGGGFFANGYITATSFINARDSMSIFSYTGSGNLSIYHGTTSDYSSIDFYNSAYSSVIGMGYADSAVPYGTPNTFYINSQGNVDMTFNWVAQTKHIFKNSASGYRVGFNQSNPQAQVHTTAASASQVGFRVDSAAAASADIAQFTLNGTGKVVIDSAGRLGVGIVSSLDTNTVLHVSGHERIDGGLCIRNATACPTFANGRLYVDTAGTAAGDDPGDVFDIAEMYAADSVSAGDVIAGTGVIEERATEFGTIKLPSVTKSKTAYQNDLLGIVSTRPAIGISGHFVVTGPEAQKDNANTAYVALSGRVPVKVTNENGSVKAGDYLTSSLTKPGYAMKATRSGQVIGQALEALASQGESQKEQGASNIITGKVLVFIKPGYQLINNTFVLEDNDGQLTSQIFKLEANTKDTAFLLNQKGSGDLLTLQQDGIDRLVVKNDGSVQMFSVQTDEKLPVLSIANQEKSLFVVYANGNLEITGTVKVSKDTSGKATIKAGNNKTKVIFEKPYSTIPNVLITPLGAPVTFALSELTESGFTIKIKDIAENNIVFTWLAVEQPEQTESDSSLEIDPVVELPPPVQPDSSNEEQTSPEPAETEPVTE